MNAILISQPAIDFSTFLGLSHKMLGVSLSAASDACHRDVSDSEKYLSCLASMHKPTAGLPPHLLTHVSFSVLIAADERDMLEILEVCAGMPFVATDTLSRGVQMAVITGTLAQWRDAVVSGCQFAVSANVRSLFNEVLALFEGVNLRVWADYTRKPNGNTFLLEYTGK